MKRILLAFAMFLLVHSGKSQTTNLAPGEYKSVIIPSYGAKGDYHRVLILLHEAFSGQNIGSNYAIGTLTALRGNQGALSRLNVADVTTASSYDNINGSVSSTYNNAGPWKLKTCVFNGKKYLALDVPYGDSWHDHGFKFTGWSRSTAEGMLAIAYSFQGNPLNQSVLSNIQDFVSNDVKSVDVSTYSVTGNLGVGTLDTKGYKLAVAGNMIAESLKVKLQGAWPDFVFEKSYALPMLEEIEAHIKEKGHLPGIPSAAEVKAHGIDLGDMNAKLLQKIEELTLHLIQKDQEIKKLNQMNDRLRLLEIEVANLSKVNKNQQ